ncbi:S8 family serine peptidase [Parabacteroides sp. Marseille-P3160]|uniref:S8 family serine peptidase n=1 Tax=Parabacteroides sp. Marseille-P3160 TaxID=1917887 RepID=UPI00135B4314|nr:S8 family serine peptidase [Parabacteroides sp. Marseille-P3160]
MKKYIYIICLSLFSVFLFSQNNSEYFYYYKGEKQYLELNTDYVFVSSIGRESIEFNNILKNAVINIRKDEMSNMLRKQQQTDKDIFWSEVKLGTNLSPAIYTDKIKQIKQSGDMIVSPYFKSPNSKKIGLSNYFYVKIKELSDTILLRKYSEQWNVIIVKQDNFMPLWFLLSCTKQSKNNTLELANVYYESNLFQYAEPDLMVEDIIGCATDEFFTNQWGLKNTGQYGGTFGVDIKACDAWNLSTGSNVTVAVVDQGIQLNHPDLQSNINSLSYDTDNGTSPSIVRGDHGTACAGIIGAVGNNAGIRGVAPNCSLMSISSTLDLLTPNIRGRIADGINWAVQNGADVISNSWAHNDLASSLIDNAITNAIINGRNGLGCIVVFLSHNDNSSIRYPANSNPDILTVGAISPCGQRKDPSSCDGENWGSNYGSQLDVVAPGVLISTTDLTENSGYNPNVPIHTGNGGNKVTSDYSNRDYTVWFNGTSAACPHVAGVAALILSVRPDLTGQQVRDVIEQTAQKVGNYSYATTTGRPNGVWNNEMGYGLVNAYAAVYAVAPRISGPSAVCDQATYTIENLPQGATVQWSATNFIPASGTGTSFTATAKNGAGQDRILATITPPSGNTIPLSLNVDLNGYEPIEGPDEGYISQKRAYFTMLGSVVVQWMVNGVVMHPDTPSRLILSPLSQYYPGNVLIICTGISDCGTFTATKDFQVIDDTEPLFLIYPNPASTSFRIKQKISENEVASDKTDNSDLSVLIYNNQSSLLGKHIVKENEPIDIHLLRDGFYIVHIIKDSKIYEAKLIIKRD